MPDDILTPGTRVMNGQLMTWEPDPKIQEGMEYLGLSREEAARMNGYTDEQIAQFDTPDGGVGRWTPATYKPPVPLWKIIAAQAALGAGGAALAAGIPALIGGGAAAAGGAGAGSGAAAAGAGAGAAGGAAGAGTAAGVGSGLAATAAPTLGLAGGTALPAGLVASSAVPGFAAGGTAAGLGAGAGTAAATGAAAPTAAAPAIGGTAAATGGAGAGAGGAGAGAGAGGAGAGAGAGGASTMGTLRSIFGGAGGTAADKQYADYIRMGLNVAGGYGQGKAAERAAQNAMAAADDADNLRRYQIERENTAANFSAPGKRLSQAQYGDIVAGLQPMTIGPDGKIVGGLSPSLYSQGTRDAASELSRRAVANALSDNASGINQTLPEKTARAVPGISDQVFGILGTAGGAADATEARRNQQSQTASLKELADIWSGRSKPGATGTTGTTPTAPADTYSAADDNYWTEGPPISGRTVDFRGSDPEEDPMDLVNIGPNQDLLGRNTRFRR